MKFEVGKTYRIASDECDYWGLNVGDEFVVSRVDLGGDAFCVVDGRMQGAIEFLEEFHIEENEVCMGLAWPATIVMAILYGLWCKINPIAGDTSNLVAATFRGFKSLLSRKEKV